MGEGEPAPAPAADIMIFISGNSGSKEITNRQHRILMILKSLGIAMKQVDISAPGMDEQRDFMRAGAKKKEGQRHALPPQIFNGEKYCGDYDDFDVANEDDELEEFLGIPRKTPKVEFENSLVISTEVHKHVRFIKIIRIGIHLFFAKLRPSLC